MELVVLGSGTAVPHAQRASAGYWLDTAQGKLLLDAGGAIGSRMAQEGLAWPELDVIWISHFHLDHIGGLPPLLFGLRHAPETRTRSRPLKIVGPAGLGRLLVAINDAGNYRLFQQPFPLELVEVNANTESELLPGLRARYLSTAHTPESLAMRITGADGISIVYTSDTGSAPDLADFVRGCDLLVIECSFPRDKPVAKHLELADVVALVNEAGPRKTLLTHLYPEWDPICLDEELRRSNAHLACELIEATDGLRLQIN
jgi:ribonuclease BN (tRNA processing enzyme)